MKMLLLALFSCVQYYVGTQAACTVRPACRGRRSAYTVQSRTTAAVRGWRAVRRRILTIDRGNTAPVVATAPIRPGRRAPTRTRSELDKPSCQRRATAAAILSRTSALKAQHRGSLRSSDQESLLQRAITSVPSHPAPQQWRELNDLVALHGGPALLGSLTNETYRPPSLENAREDRCQLTPSLDCRRFSSQPINAFLAGLFRQISQHPLLPAFQLCRYDLFHGHLFLDHTDRQMGILFHAQEYPAYDEETFPIFLGFCQENSTLTYDEQKMRVRNILWWDDCLHVLDTGKGSILNDRLLQDGLRDFVYTVDEADFGERVLDISYFDTADDIRDPAEHLYVC